MVKVTLKPPPRRKVQHGIVPGQALGQSLRIMINDGLPVVKQQGHGAGRFRACVCQADLRSRPGGRDADRRQQREACSTTIQNPILSPSQANTNLSAQDLGQPQLVCEQGSNTACSDCGTSTGVTQQLTNGAISNDEGHVS